MSKRRIYALVTGLAAVTAVALMLIFVVLPGGSAARRIPEAAPVEIAAPGAVVQETASKPGSPVEGITVHGHWTIEVRNPDGSLVERREFENALLAHGETIISRVLAHQLTVGPWGVNVSATSAANSPCTDENGNPSFCLSTERDIPPGMTGNWFFNTLEVSVPTTGPNANKIVLSGSVVASRDGILDKVSTSFGTCTSDTAPDSCTGEATGAITNTTIPSAITVLNGQTVLITVVIGFS